MKLLTPNQDGFITEIVVILTILIVAIVFVFMRVHNARWPLLETEIFTAKSIEKLKN
jgi:hypothetical protein